MKKQVTILIGAILVMTVGMAGFATALLSTTTEVATGTTAATATNTTNLHTVNISENNAVGSYLVDQDGMTLYNFSADSPGTSACYSDCLVTWPIFLAEQVTVPETLNASDFGTVNRTDGARHTTFKGMPLYYYVGDTNPGDTTGKGISSFGGVWNVVVVNAAANATTEGATPTAETTTAASSTIAGY